MDQYKLNATIKNITEYADLIDRWIANIGTAMEDYERGGLDRDAAAAKIVRAVREVAKGFFKFTDSACNDEVYDQILEERIRTGRYRKGAFEIASTRMAKAVSIFPSVHYQAADILSIYPLGNYGKINDHSIMAERKKELDKKYGPGTLPNYKRSITTELADYLCAWCPDMDSEGDGK
jgi:hypothetical protein